MDRKQLFTGVAMAMAVVGLWYLFVFYMEKTHPELMHPPVAATQPSGELPPVPTTFASTLPTTGAATAPAPDVPGSTAAVRAVPADSSAAPVVLGSAEFES